MKIKLIDIAQAIKGRLITENVDIQVEKIVTKINQIEENCLFYIYDGFEDEDKFILTITKHKVAAVIVKSSQVITIEKWNKINVGVIQVENKKSYFRLAAFLRLKYEIPFIEVIGSAGKTTTKEMIGAILNEKMNILVGEKNYNSPIAVAKNIFGIKETHQAVVLEAGMKRLGVIDSSSQIIKPSIGVLTTLQRAHINRLGSMEKIIQAKAEILNHLSDESCFILNGENEYCCKFPLKDYKGEILRYGFSEKMDIWASDIESKGDWTFFTVNTNTLKFKCAIHTFGKYNVGNALAAILVGLRLGLSPDEIVSGLQKFRPFHSRLEIMNITSSNFTIVNDNFNANPDSTRLLLEDLSPFVKDRPLILVMGDMEAPKEELSEYSRKIHYEIGEIIGQMKIHKLIAIGKWAEEYVKGALNQGKSSTQVAYFKTVSEAESLFKQSLIPNCVVVFKASPYVMVNKLMDVM